MLRKTRRKLVAGTCAVALVIGVGTAVGAAKLSRQQESAAVIADAAKDLGVSSADLTAALKKAMTARIDAAVAAGTMTAAQGAEAKARIASGEIPLVGLGGPGRGHDGHGGGLHFETSGAAASYLGLTEAQLRTAREAGKSLATIAADRGKSVAGLIDAMVAAATKQVNAAVTAGNLTDAQRDDILATLEERITEKVNSVGHGPGHRDG